MTVAYLQLLLLQQSHMVRIRVSVILIREHLYKCFSGRKLLPFPENIATLIKNNIQSSTDDIAVHCYCRMPELKDVPMIECSSCFKWFHVACCHDSITDEQLKELDTTWCCQVCQ